MPLPAPPPLLRDAPVALAARTEASRRLRPRGRGGGSLAQSSRSHPPLAPVTTRSTARAGRADDGELAAQLGSRSSACRRSGSHRATRSPMWRRPQGRPRTPQARQERAAQELRARGAPDAVVQGLRAQSPMLWPTRRWRRARSTRSAATGAGGRPRPRRARRCAFLASTDPRARDFAEWAGPEAHATPLGQVAESCR